MTADLAPLPTAALLEALGGVGVLEAQVVEKLAQYARMPVAVACSGGPDSVAVALITRALHDGALTLLHFNHKLRGAQGDRDEAFVRQLAARLGCDVRVGVWENPSAQNETVAREARLAWLQRWEHEAIVFGQHADDAAETFLMRLARGASAEGLTAPHPVREHARHLHLRPLLKLRKATVVEALEKLGVEFCVDATNQQNHYLRNRIRNELLPLWQSLEPQRDVVGGILRSREGLMANISLGDAAPPVAAQALLAWPKVSLPLGTTIFLPNFMAVRATVCHGVKLSDIRAQTDPACRVWVRAQEPLFLRIWQQGERYCPWGAPGARKVKSILNEQLGEVPPQLRALWPMVVGPDDQPWWLPAARITPAGALGNQEIDAVELRFFTNLSKLAINA